MGELPTGTVTFLFTDLERSTELWEEQPLGMQGALARHDELLAAAVDAHGGHVIKSTGDGVHAVFASAPDAVAAAVAAQRALESESWESVGSLKARVGLDTGVAEQRGNDYFGAVLNRAARLTNVGHGGQILISRATEELVRDALPEGCELVDLGAHQLRGIARPIGIAQVAHRDLARAFPPLRVLRIESHNLPIQLSTFVGREAELVSLEQVLADARLLTLTGAGGCGKTRLAIELARRVVESFEQGVWFVDLAPVSDARAVPSTIARALDLRDDGRRPLDQIVGHLRDGNAMLVLDNCEHVISAIADAVTAVLTQCGAVTIIATSREPLGVVGERPWRVPSLSVPERGRPDPEELRGFESIQLFVERAHNASASFTFTSETADDVAGICARLDGIPLAIELAAARVRMMSLRQIRDGLANRFHLLTGGARTAVRRQQTLRASVDWSFELLGTEERLLLQRLSAFAGGFTLDAVQEVCAGDGVRDTETLDLLTGLVDRSLVQADEGSSVVRYRLLETIRDYAAEQLVNAGEADRVRDHHAAFFASVAERAEPHLERHEQRAWVELLESERANLRGAIDWAATQDDGETAQRIVAALIWFYVISGHLREAKKLFDIALDTPGATTPTHARALQARAYLGWHRQEGLHVFAMAAEATELAREVGDRRAEARALYVTGILTAVDGGGSHYLDTSIAIARELGDLWCLAHALGGAGSSAFTLGEPERSRALLRESIAVCEDMGDTYILNTSRFWLGRNLLAAGEHAAGTAMLEAVVRRARETGDTFSLPMALSHMGMDAALRGDEERAFANLDEAAAIARRVGLPRTSQLINALWTKATILLAKQDERARAPLEELMALAVELGAEQTFIPSAGLAMVDLFEGDISTAEARVAAAWAALPADARPFERSFVTMVAAWTARAGGDLITAQRWVREALALDAYEPGGPAWSWRIEILELLAGVFLVSERARDAVRLLAATNAERARTLRPKPPTYEEHLARDLATARELLGEPETNAAWSEGRAMTIDDAIAIGRSRP